ncbi:UDP-4-amino-4,6-dideoxy-N-acetyl-beta-L-altrosamine transaminase [Shewanella sp.]|jgi:UDP-4-amino-4,6-dideoxy-N-acetyl-beta-L-altrosamine transaminase|uniref:UDP-4-amino-4, 6-dideoxy-N-acetyl-beta-L-altrosamine transaminase n=1 Tax=Shewanella sp. TaxID=50422 RepID=UPI004048DD9F
MIPYGKQAISQSDIDAVLEVLNSDFLTQGPKVPAFEAALVNSSQASYAVAVNSATSALHIACLALGVGPSDWVWTSPITFVASANCALYCGAKVDFVDISPSSYNMCPKLLEKKLIVARENGTLPKVVIPVHLAGQSCDMQAIHALSMRFGFKIIEDASHAIGGRYLNKPVGSCIYSDITVFSFHPVKIVTTAEGGAVLTNSVLLADKMRLLRSHGITREPENMRGDSDGPWYYEQIALGFNYRMTELQAALGISQLNRLEEFVARRHYLANRYHSLLTHLPLSLPRQHPDAYSAWHLYIIQLDLSQITKTHLQVFSELRSQGIGVNLHYIPVHLQPYYQDMGFKKGDFSHAEHYYQHAISLPIFFGMTDEMQDKIVNVLSDIVE